MDLIPFFKLVEMESFSSVYPFTGPMFLSPPCTLNTQPVGPRPPDSKISPVLSKNGEDHCPSEPDVPKRCVIPKEDIEALVDLVQRTSSNFKESISERMLYMLLLSVLEAVSIRSGSRGTTQISSTVHLLHGVTTLFEDVIALWLQAYNKDGIKQTGSGGSPDHTPPGASNVYKGTVHIARITLRLWLVLSSQVLHSSLSSQQIADVKPLLSSPLASVAKACFNLQQAGLFKGNECLDHEFTLIILESDFSSFFAANVCAVVPVCSVDDFYEVLRDALTDGSHEWFTYLCSKLHGISETLLPALQQQHPDEEDPLKVERNGDLPSSWVAILDYSFQILAYILKELIAISSHIRSCQKASKLALTSNSYDKNKHHMSVPFPKPVVYSLEVATGFDKLTQRLSKIAQLLLDMFRTVPLIQLLSLQLLSETAKDTIGTISNFLTSISDPSVRSNPEVLDLYLELLENIWFQLSSDYPASSPWWKKLSNYYILLLESNQEIVCQVIYHLQCLFGHDSAILKSRLTQYVIIPFYQHLTSRIKEVCYNTTSKPNAEGSSSPVSSGVDDHSPKASLESNERMIISLFMKLLAKVMSSSHSLGKFASDSSNIYSLFLFLPLDEFRGSVLVVLEECLHTLKTSSAERSVTTSPSISEANEAAPKSEETGIQKTILQILLTLAFSVQVEKIPDRCLSIAEGRASLPTYGLREVDQIEQLVRNTFEAKPIKDLLEPSFVRHLAVVADVWSVLNNLAASDNLTTKILNENNMWDVIRQLGPSLSSLLSRLQQRLSREETFGPNGHLLDSLRESTVTLLSHLLTLAHFLCWKKGDHKVWPV